MTCDCRRNNRKDKAILKRIRGHYRVIADGVDVTDGCFYLDARRRIVKVFVKNEYGDFVLNESKTALQSKTLRPRRVRFSKRSELMIPIPGAIEGPRSSQ